MFGENTKYVLALTALALMVYTTPNIQNAMKAPVDASTQSAAVLSATVSSASNHVNCPDGYVCTPIPYVKGCPDRYVCVISASSTLTVLSPSGGQTYIVGNTIHIKWQATNVPADYVAYIALVPAQPMQPFADVPTSGYCNQSGGCVPLSQGSFDYKIPSKVLSGQYSFQISCWPKNSEVSDCAAKGQSGYFTIINGTSTLATTTPVLPPSFSVIGTPTINKIQAVSGVSGNGTTTYTASFTLQVQSGSSGAVFGLPGSNMPAVASNGTFIAINRNGVPTTMSNAAIVSYSAPSNAVPNTNGASFSVPANQQVTIPITVSFFVGNPGANVYSVQLNAIRWSPISAAQSYQTTAITGAVTPSI
jgi:hypothetical protein